MKRRIIGVANNQTPYNKIPGAKRTGGCTMNRLIAWTVIAVLWVALSFSGAQQPLKRPDLIVSNIDFQKVESGTDAAGKTYWLFNVGIKVKNQGNASAGAFKVLLERNIGPGGAYQTACQTCLIDVPGLGAGQETALEPRQFNNAMGAPSKFKATVDSAGQVSESNEGNNSREEAFISMSIAGPGGVVTQAALPDLTVVSFDFQDVISAVVDGKTIITFRMNATVKNLGPGSSPASVLYFLGSADTKVGFSYLHNDLPPLAPGAQTALVSNSRTYEVGTPIKYYSAYINYEHGIKEVTESNNQTPYKKIPGVI